MAAWKVITEAGLRRTVVRGDELPLLSYDGGDSYACGSCEAVLVERSWRWQIQNVALTCPRCGALNEAPPI
jgi:predicted RNA-binding Zn-ribbon protein involved in translation (DUF1610 family)